MPLLPICHTTQQAQVEIAINDQGQFLRARIVDSDDARTIIPATEQSASRAGSKPVHHPLCDKLQYIAGDFVQYGGKVTSGYAKNPTEPFEMFVEDLEKWCASSHRHPKVEAIFRYVQRQNVIRGLVECGILHVNEKNQLFKTW